MSPIKIALEKPLNLTTASKYTVFNGFVYFLLGVLLILWPGAVQTLLGERPFVGDEQRLMRVLGMTVCIIGYYLLVGGNSGSRQATAASVIDRLTIVPLVLLPLVIEGVFPRLFVAIVIVDICLAISTWVALNRVEATEALSARSA
jgi:uncharacterized membrane protein